MEKNHAARQVFVFSAGVMRIVTDGVGGTSALEKERRN
jgi:hypothetical protein